MIQGPAGEGDLAKTEGRCYAAGERQREDRNARVDRADPRAGCGKSGRRAAATWKRGDVGRRFGGRLARGLRLLAVLAPDARECLPQVRVRAGRVAKSRVE